MNPSREFTKMINDRKQGYYTSRNYSTVMNARSKHLFLCQQFFHRQQVQVGDIVKVVNGQFFPADLIILSSR